MGWIKPQEWFLRWQPRSWLSQLGDYARGHKPGMLGEARVIDAYLVRERLRSGERFAELFRWSFIILFLLLDVVQPAGGRSQKILVYALLMLWALVNLIVTIPLLRGYRPNRWFCYATTGVDVMLASALVGVTGGLNSPFYLAFFLVIISSSIRFGLLAAVFTSIMVSLLFFYLGGYATTVGGGQANIEEVLSKVIVFVVVGTMTGMMSQEMIRERQVAIGRAAEKDALQGMINEITASIDLHEILKVVRKQALAIVGGGTGRILLVSADNTQVHALGASGDLTLAFGDAQIQEERVKPRLLNKGQRMLVPIQAKHSEDLILIDLEGQHGFGRRQFDMVAQLACNAAGPVNNSLRYLSKETEATLDGLTGLVNQREMRRLLGVMIKRHKENQEAPFSLMMIDIDRFKQINDSRGHEYGNEVLKKAANLIVQTMRSKDVVVRYGGDEMAVVMAGASLAVADQAAERLVAAVRGAHIQGEGEGELTFSIGVAAYPEYAESIEGLIEAADQGLYMVKRAGRNGSGRLPTKAERTASA